MIRRLLLLLLLLQAAAAAALAGCLHQRWLLAWPLALALGGAAIVLLRTLLALQNYYQSRRHASPTPAALQLGVAQALRMFWDDLAASLRYSSSAMLRPLGWRLLPAPQQRGLPVLLLHGYLCNSGYWHPLSRALSAARISHAGIDLQPLWCGIDEYLVQVHAAVLRLCAETGSAQVILVGHSMGGLVARAYLRRYGEDRIAHVITLGTPHAGSALAALAPGRNGAQMRPGSDWLVQLAAAESPARRATLTSLYSVHDNMVAPQASSVLAGSRVRQFGGIGHVALGWSSPVIAAVLDEIATINARRASLAGTAPLR